MVLWSMGGGGGGGYRATLCEMSGGQQWDVRWQGGGGSGAGVQWDEYGIGGGGGGGCRLSAVLSSTAAPRTVSINVSHGAQPDTITRLPSSATALASLNGVLSSRMRRCIQHRHTLRISGGGGAGGGYKFPVRLDEGVMNGEKARHVQSVVRLQHSLEFHFELALDTAALDWEVKQAMGQLDLER